MDILIAGGGVAGLEGLLALHHALGDRAHLTLVAPEHDFSYRPLASAEPFGLGHSQRVPLRRFVNATCAELLIDRVTGVDDAAGEVRLAGGGTRSFDALLLAPGARAVAGVEGATTWWPGGDPQTYGGLLRDLEEGYAKRLAVVVPPGAVWPLPAYELALMTAGEVREMREDVSVVVVTPEDAPLALLGEPATEAAAEELRLAGVELHTGSTARVDGRSVVLEPSGERLDVDRVLAVPRLVGPAIDGLPADEEGFVMAGDDARVEGCRRTWAAGDGVASPVKFGGLATHQARRAVAGIVRAAGGEAEDPGAPVIKARLLVGRRMRALGSAPEWPDGKLAGEHLPRWLAENVTVRHPPG